MESTVTYRQAAQAEAEYKLNAAQVAMANARTRNARREAAEDVEFRGSRVAFLQHLRHGAFQDEARA